MIKLFLGVLLSVIFYTQLGLAEGVRLPVHSLMDQGNTAHCWAYAMSNFLESRALVREQTDVTINIEQDVKYWVDYERMMYIYKTKGDFYLDFDYEGGWQIEYWEAFLKHGRQILQVKNDPPDVWYQPLITFTEHLPHMPVSRPNPDPTLPKVDELKDILTTQIKSEEEAKTFIIDYLNRAYGRALDTTRWFGQTISTEKTAQLLLGQDYVKNHSIDSLVLVKPVSDGNYGWAKYLQDRYWGYRMDYQKVLPLIEHSLDNKWPVTFDNVWHAMTIVGYEKTDKGTFYAVADSVPGEIRWVPRNVIIDDLNLVTFSKEAIKGAIPTRDERLAPVLSRFNIDKIDHTEVPPGARL